jgi:hypothetical protein
MDQTARRAVLTEVRRNQSNARQVSDAADRPVTDASTMTLQNQGCRMTPSLAAIRIR